MLEKMVQIVTTDGKTQDFELDISSRVYYAMGPLGENLRIETPYEQKDCAEFHAYEALIAAEGSVKELKGYIDGKELSLPFKGNTIVSYNIREDAKREMRSADYSSEETLLLSVLDVFTPHKP